MYTQMWDVFCWITLLLRIGCAQGEDMKLLPSPSIIKSSSIVYGMSFTCIKMRSTELRSKKRYNNLTCPSPTESVFNACNSYLCEGVGMRIQLHGTTQLAKWSLRNALGVTYPLHHDWLLEIWRLVAKQRHSQSNHPGRLLKKSYTDRVPTKNTFFSQYRTVLAKPSELVYSLCIFIM